MFRLTARPYVFTRPPDSDWLPSRHLLFEECSPQDTASAEAFFFVQGQRLKADWDDRESQIDRLRAELDREISFS